MHSVGATAKSLALSSIFVHSLGIIFSAESEERCSNTVQLAFMMLDDTRQQARGLRFGHFEGDFQTFRYATIFWKGREKFAVFHQVAAEWC
jgi:hypothetical protein